MTSGHTFVAEAVVLELFTKINNQQRLELLRIFQSLADNPYLKGDRILKTKSGRKFQSKRFGRWLVGFWLDSAVLEVKIISVEK